MDILYDSGIHDKSVEVGAGGDHSQTAAPAVEATHGGEVMMTTPSCASYYHAKRIMLTLFSSCCLHQRTDKKGDQNLQM